MELFYKCFQKIIIMLLNAYRYLLSPFLGIGSQCRFYPSCSEYALTAIKQLPVHQGLALILWRLFRCHPFCSGGYDPVPLQETKSK